MDHILKDVKEEDKVILLEEFKQELVRQDIQKTDLKRYIWKRCVSTQTLSAVIQVCEDYSSFST